MKTTLRIGGILADLAARTAAKHCANISCVSSERWSPMAPVAQKAHARLQPTWLETQRVEKRAEGIMTDSTAWPSSSLSSSLRVPQVEAVLSSTVEVSCSRVAAALLSPAPSASGWASGLSPLRRYDQSSCARPAPPTACAREWGGANR